MCDGRVHYLNIAGLLIRMESEKPVVVRDPFAPFLTGQGPADYTLNFRFVPTLPELSGQPLYRDPCFGVYPDGQGTLRSFYREPSGIQPYALTRYDHPGGTVTVDCLEEDSAFVSAMSNAFFHVGIENLMIHRDRLCLHAACVDTAWGGILFSGPSGIGKSTQAQLWSDLRGGRVINGDRPILSKDGGWLAWGSPYAGSSRCHVNENCPVRAIVMLRKAPECTVRRLKTAEAFRRVYTSLTVNTWDDWFVRRACDLAMELAAAVPVYELSCTPDEQAVRCLESELGRENAT